jgi:hypothetical protein
MQSFYCFKDRALSRLKLDPEAVDRDCSWDTLVALLTEGKTDGLRFLDCVRNIYLKRSMAQPAFWIWNEDLGSSDNI